MLCSAGIAAAEYFGGWSSFSAHEAYPTSRDATAGAGCVLARAFTGHTRAEHVVQTLHMSVQHAQPGHGKSWL